MFDEEPEDLHGECAAEIHRMRAENRRLLGLIDEACEDLARGESSRYVHDNLHLGAAFAGDATQHEATDTNQSESIRSGGVDRSESEWRTVDELATLVRMLARELPEDATVRRRALDYLSRHGLTGSPPRASAAQPEGMAGHSDPAFTPFPDIGCEGDECAFNTAGIGLQCETCKAYLHPGDKHYAEVKSYYEQETPND